MGSGSSSATGMPTSVSIDNESPKKDKNQQNQAAMIRQKNKDDGREKKDNSKDHPKLNGGLSLEPRDVMISYSHSDKHMMAQVKGKALPSMFMLLLLQY